MTLQKMNEVSNNTKSSGISSFKFKENMLKRDNNKTFMKYDIGKYYIYERLKDIIGIKMYVVQQNYTKDRREFTNMKIMHAVSNIMYIGNSKLSDDMMSNNQGPLVKTFTQL